jgi:hypothetical protein
VLTEGKNFKLFINGSYIHQYDDNTYSAGYFGLFVRPQKTNRFTIYADKVSYWTDVPDIKFEDAPTAPDPTTETPNPNYTPPFTYTEEPTATPTPTSTGVSSNLDSLLVSAGLDTSSDHDPRTKLSGPDWKDNLDNGTYWPIDQDEFSIAKMGQGVLEFTSLTKATTWRLTRTLPLGNAYREIVFKTNNCPGSNGYGLYFHADGKATKGYLFGITCDGSYFLDKWDVSAPLGSQKHEILTDTPHLAILAGYGGTNRVGVLTYNKKLAFYVNGKYVTELPESTFTSGYFGAFIRPDSAEKFSIEIDEACYWLD